MRNGVIACLLMAVSGLAWSVTAITYQGQLQENGQPFDGQADLTFELFDHPDPAVGNSVAGPIEINDVDVVDGLFQVNLPFGNVYEGERFLQVTVGTDDLLPRQRIAQTPVAMLALNVKDGVSGVWEKSGDEISYSANNQEISFTPHANPSFAPTIVMGHSENLALARGATVSGGGWENSPNRAEARASTVSGGEGNRTTGLFGTISGGVNNIAAESATVSGGGANMALGLRSTVSGGLQNRAIGDYSTIGGGGLSDLSDQDTSNRVEDHYGTIAGGGNNRAGSGDGDPQSSEFATIGGGEGNAATARGTTISGGIGNAASGDRATVGGGAHNIASEELSTVGGGVGNQATGLVSVIGGGFSNAASGSYATVAGGMLNEAEGNFSLAAGRRAKIQDTHRGTFVWADSTNEDFFSTAADQFRVRASGGAEFDTGATGLKAFSNSDTTAGAAIQAESANPSGIALVGRNKSDDATLALNNTGLGPLIRAFSGNTLLLELENSGDMTIDGNLTENSDLHAKESIRPVDNQQVLQRLINLDVTTWRYKDSPEGGRHIGPMAQDFYELFGFGKSETSIAGMDVRGVALAAIQALYEENIVLKNRLDELETRNAELQTLTEHNADLEMRLSELEALLLEGKAVVGANP